MLYYYLTSQRANCQKYLNFVANPMLSSESVTKIKCDIHISNSKYIRILLARWQFLDPIKLAHISKVMHKVSYILSHTHKVM